MGQSPRSGPTAAEIASELERQNALHEGWLKHPSTIFLIRNLEEVLNLKGNALCTYALTSPHVVNPYAPEFAVLTKVLNTIKNNLKYA